MSQRKFPGPWRVEATEGAFIIIDANGFSIAHIYWKQQPALHDEQVAKLPELLAQSVD